MAKKYYKYNEKNNSVHVFLTDQISEEEAFSMLNSINGGTIKDRESVIKFVTAASVLLKKEFIAEDMDKGLIRTKFYRINRLGDKTSIRYSAIRSALKKKMKNSSKPIRNFRKYTNEQVEEFWINVCNKYGFRYAGIEYKKNKDGENMEGLSYSYVKLNVGKPDPVRLSLNTYVGWKNGTLKVKWLDKQIRLTYEKETNGVDNSMLKYNFKERIKEALSKVRKFFS